MERISAMGPLATEANRKVDTVSCVVCSVRTPANGAFCQWCHAPIEISQAVTRRGTPPRFLPILGPSAAGKTVYLGLLLDMLSKGSGSLRGVPNGPFSLAVQQETIRSLQKRRFPDKTRSEADDWRWVHCEVSPANRPRRITDIVTPDLAGEAIAMEVDRPGSYPIIGSVVLKSAGIIVLFDSQRARDNGREEDLFAMKLISYLENTLTSARPRWRKHPMPLAVVYTKCDACPEATRDPHRFAAATMPGLVQSCSRHFTQSRYFATGMVGSYAVATDGYGRRSRIPLHVEPHGVLEPLEWVAAQ
jgi:hypothetical protein